MCNFCGISFSYLLFFAGCGYSMWPIVDCRCFQEGENNQDQSWQGPGTGSFSCSWCKMFLLISPLNLCMLCIFILLERFLMEHYWIAFFSFILCISSKNKSFSAGCPQWFDCFVSYDQFILKHSVSYASDLTGVVFSFPVIFP